MSVKSRQSSSPAGRPEADNAGKSPGPAAASEAGHAAHVAVIERLFCEHNEALIRFLLTRLRSYQEAREVAQEAYVRLLSLDEPGAVSYLRAFLYKTAANLATDRLRREHVHQRATELPLFNESADSLSPERRVAGAQEIQRLQRLLEDLPPKCRQAFVLNRFYGLDLAVVAREMGLKQRMVRIYVVRALLYCRSHFDSEAAGLDESHRRRQETDHG